MNPSMKKLRDTILASPEIKFPNNSTKGYIAAVYYEDRKCDVVYWSTDGTKTTKKRLDVPKEGDGVFHESLKPGDIVEISFKGKTHEGMFISGVQKRNRKATDFSINKGQELPISTNLF